MTSVVWLPGGRGMLGQAAQRVLAGLDDVTAVVSGREVPIDDENAVRTLLARERVTHILSCAAYTAVDKAESEPDEAARANAEGPRVLARAAAERGLPVLHVSTDYVFPGDATAPLREDAQTGPRSVYGRTKLDGERAFLEGASDVPHYVVRTSWLFGREGNHFVATMLRLMREREELRVVVDQRGRPTFADDLAAAAAGLLGLDAKGPRDAASGIYHFASAGETTWHGFAEVILERARGRGVPLRCERVLPIATTEYPTPAARPSYSVLDTTKVERVLGRAPAPFTDGLDLVLDDAARQGAMT